MFAGLLWPLALAGGMLVLLPGLLPALGAASLAGLGLTWWMQSMLKRRLGGYTGDNLGATQQLVELGLLLGLLAVAHAA